jgi:4-phytase/acid phosphatase
MIPFRSLRSILACVCWLPAALYAQTPPAPAAKLEYVAVMSRHGVRTSTWSNDRLNEYSIEPWPQWDVATGALTPRGRVQMKLLGAYDRDYLNRARLIASNGCDDANRFYFWSDTTPRDIESGQWLAAGLFPGCQVAIHAVAQGNSDPLFSPMSLLKPDAGLSAAALLGRLGGRPETLDTTYRGQLEAMERVLLGCDPGKNCPPAKAPKQSLLEQTSAVRIAPGRLAQLTGPLGAASTLAETFLMEYADGKQGRDLGWGRLDKAKVRELMFLQDAYIELTMRTPYLARANGSNLLSHMLRSMQQAVRGEKVEGALGKPGDRGLYLLGHDSDVSYLAGTLGISWLLADYAPNCRPPGGAIVFEIWRETVGGKRSVRTYLRAQSLDQLRDATPLGLQTPPAKAPIFVPGCSTAAEGWPCDWDAFQRTVQAAIDPAFVTAAAPAPRAGETH